MWHIECGVENIQEQQKNKTQLTHHTKKQLTHNKTKILIIPRTTNKSQQQQTKINKNKTKQHTPTTHNTRHQQLTTQQPQKNELTQQNNMAMIQQPKRAYNREREKDINHPKTTNSPIIVVFRVLCWCRGPPLLICVVILRRTWAGNTTSNNSPARRQSECARNWHDLHGPHRLVVRTSRCGRDNPGSTPGVDSLASNGLLIHTHIILIG